MENAGGTGKTNEVVIAAGLAEVMTAAVAVTNITLPTVRLVNQSTMGRFFIFQDLKNPITIVCSSNIISIQTNLKNGIYRYLDTSLLEPGVYLVQTRSEKDGVSTTIFTVGTNVFPGGTGSACPHYWRFE